MSAPRLCVTDLRNPDHWADIDRARPASLVVCSSRWTERPIPGAITLAYVNPGYDTWHDQLLDAGDIEGDFGRAARNDDWDIIQTQRRCLYRDSYDGGTNGENLYAVNLASAPTAWAAGDWLRKRLPQFDGYLVCYYTGMGYSLEFRGPLFSDPYWSKWDRGLHRFASALAQGGKLVVGQQYHLTSAMAMTAVNGLYFEQSPWRWGLGPSGVAATIDAQQAEGMGPATQIVELRDPFAWPLAYRQQVLDLCTKTNAFCSWGRGFAAGQGYPA